MTNIPKDRTQRKPRQRKRAVLVAGRRPPPEPIWENQPPLAEAAESDHAKVSPAQTPDDTPLHEKIAIPASINGRDLTRRTP